MQLTVEPFDGGGGGVKKQQLRTHTAKTGAMAVASLAIGRWHTGPSPKSIAGLALAMELALRSRARD